ncbi:MAG: acyl-ACP--UDP-N-acetylglucosamine O-acyltransferase [Melioribacteraceae bacterium]|nr:acyl-ACP--UDP-N-acetylglucosamine O-acyltransferase [Melioribacteraceae bacterium]
MELIHPTAIVSPKAQLGNNVKVGPFAIIHDNVIIDDDSEIFSHAVIYDGARLGKRVRIFQSASISNVPQDLKFKDEKTYVEIGDDTAIREFATLHRATVEGESTRIGKNCLIMAYAHVAHDCIVGNNVIMANTVQLAGHVEIEDFVIIGGLAAVHQFTRIGKHSMIGAGCKLVSDIPPYIIAAGYPTKFSGLNSIGLRRRGFTVDQINSIKNVYRIFYNSGLNFAQAKEKIKNELADNIYGQEIIEFMSKTTRTILTK